MKEYIIKRKADWSQIPQIEMSEKLKPFETDVRAFGKICWDESALYVRLRAVEAQIRAEQSGKFDMPCEDSCLEFFFSPDAASKRYFNVEMNPNCSMFLGLGHSIRDLVRLRPMNQNDYGFDAVSEYTPDGWQLTYRIPFSFIRLFFPEFSPKPGDILMANVYKCGDKCAVPHWLTWNSVDPTVSHAFHNPNCFGRMVFGA